MLFFILYESLARFFNICYPFCTKAGRRISEILLFSARFSEQLFIYRAVKEADHQGTERGRAEGLKLAKTIFRLSAQGVSAEEIAQQCGLSADQVREVLE